MNYTNQTPTMYFRWKTCLSSTLVKNEKIFIKCAQMIGAHLQCVNNHYAKFENEKNENCELQITQIGHHLSIFTEKKLSSRPQK